MNCLEVKCGRELVEEFERNLRGGGELACPVELSTHTGPFPEVVGTVTYDKELPERESPPSSGIVCGWDLGSKVISSS